MSTITLEKIHEDIIGLKKEMEHIKAIIQEDYMPADDVVKDIKESRNRPKKDLIPHEQIKKEFG